MLEYDFNQQLQMHHTDKYGLIVPGTDNVTLSANGLYYTAILQQLLKSNKFLVDFHYNEKVESCFKEPGLPMRNPENTHGQEQWDNLLGITLGCEITDNQYILREIISYGIKHLFVFNTDDKLEFRDWLGRYPHLWMMMFASAYPITKYFLYLPLLVISKSFKPSPNDMSGNLLQYVFISTFSAIYNNRTIIDKWVQEVNKTVPNGLYGVFSVYFGPNHPFSKIILENGKY
jgi:hypothetical protein